MNRDTTLRIYTQYYENYGFAEGGEHWKPKGGQEFTMKVDSDLFLYEKERCIEAIKTLLAKRCDELNRYEYVSHELIFHDPIELNVDHFEKELMIQQ